MDNNNQYQNNQGFNQGGQNYPANGQQNNTQPFNQQQYNAAQNAAQQQYYQQQYEMQQQAQQQYYQQQAGQENTYNSPAQGYVPADATNQNNYKNNGNSGSGSANGGNGGKKKTGLIIGIIAAVAVIAAIIIVIVVLKNKKDDKKDSDDKKTTEATTDVNDTEEATTEALSTEEITEEATTEEASGERYYKLINIINDKDTDYVALLEDLNNEGKYNFGVFNYDDHTGYIVVAGAILGSEFTFDDTSITMDGEKSDMVIDGDNLSINLSGETLEFVSISYDEFAVMYEAYNSGSDYIYFSSRDIIPEDTVVPFQNVSVTIPGGYQTIGYIDTSDEYMDHLNLQYVDENAGCVVEYYLEKYTYWHLDENSIEYYAGEEGIEWTDTDIQLDNGMIINYARREESDNMYMTNAALDDYEAGIKYSNGISFVGFMECDGKVYRISITIDSDFYGEETENVLMGLLNGINKR